MLSECADVPVDRAGRARGKMNLHLSLQNPLEAAGTVALLWGSPLPPSVFSSAK